jgi:hypothetical protein
MENYTIYLRPAPVVELNKIEYITYRNQSIEALITGNKAETNRGNFILINGFWFPEKSIVAYVNRLKKNRK